ncbi:hypothetical protein [uncultured Draconibacterium sp.]|uniref:hypothetical protein n=1 Tax=uncultured Draconibacterium sp. TaxID=1573823 RepID=UPI00321702C1
MFEDKTPFDSEKLVDEVFKTEPAYFLSDNFAEVMAGKAGRHFAWKQYIKEFLIYLAVIFGILVMTAGMAFFWFDANMLNWFDFLISNLTLVAGINFLVIFVLFADRVLLRYFLYRTSLD